MIYFRKGKNVPNIIIFFGGLFMKKRVSIFATLALCVTVGGVYATWTYAQNAANSLDNVSVTKQLTTAEVVEKGDIVTVGENTLTLTVDKAEDSYDAVLTITGQLQVAFQPHELSSETEINLQYTISGTNLEYDGTPIFVLPTEAQLLGEDNTWTLNSDNLAVTMGAITLPTYDDYLAFEEAFSSVTLTITFSEVPSQAV